MALSIKNYIDDIKDKEKFLKNINSIEDNIANTIHIIDYEVTTKISYYYLNNDIPISRNSNTIVVKSNYAAYIYYLTLYILIGLNTYEYYSYGEFIISCDEMITLIEEVTQFITNTCDKYNVDEQLIKLKEIITKLVLDKEFVLDKNINVIKSAFLSYPNNNSRLNIIDMGIKLENFNEDDELSEIDDIILNRTLHT
jgi:hypothetical protein